ncbi:MAG: DUF4976 domain-containing protein [Chloroflexi bacterium]|nr:MAG: DUF4976 domain-containing protein [Chloroflexota bacterium]
MTKRPHIIIFNPDQWRGDVLGYAGNPAAVTPNLDQWVQTDAVGFRHAFCQSPVCTPSRCSFMTGWYPHVHGHRTMFHMLRPHEPMLLRSLKQAGYFVWWGGKNDVVPAQYGFDKYCHVKYEPPEGGGHPYTHLNWRGDPDGDNYYSFYVGRIEKPEGAPYAYDSDWGHIEGALEFLKNLPPTVRDGETPLCLYLPLEYPHPPYAVEDPWHNMIDREKLPPRVLPPEGWRGKPAILAGIYEHQRMHNWDEARWTELRATYYGMCARVDYQFGLVLDALKEAGIYDDAAIFFFADHGEYAGDYGIVEKAQNTFEDCLVNVPFAIKPPKTYAIEPHVNTALVELTDFSATVEALACITPQHTHFGRNLLPLMQSKAETWRDAVFSQGGALPQDAHLHDAPYEEGHLYGPRLRFQSGEDMRNLKATMLRTAHYKYVHRLGDTDELYDLQEDPTERNNRIDDPTLKAVREQLRERLLRFYLETGDVVPHDLDKRW